MSWPLVALGDICTFHNGDRGKNYPSKGDFVNEGVRFINAGDLKNQKIATEEVSLITEEHFERLGGGKVSEGDILFCLRGSLGKFAVVGNSIPGAIASSLVIIRCGENIFVDYLKFYLNCFLCEQEISKYKNGAAQPNLSARDLKKFLIPLPNLSEQKRIAAILDKADHIRQKRQQAIEMADQFLRSVFLDMFGDINSPVSKARKISMTDCFDIKTGKLNSNAAVSDGNYPFFTCAKEVFSIDSYAFNQEALLLAGNNAQADYDVKYYNGKFNAYQRTYVLTLKNESDSYSFFKYALEKQLENLKKNSKGSNTKYITMEIMSRTYLPYPSISDQNRFSIFYECYDRKIKNLEKSYFEAGRLFDSISSHIFS